MELDSVSAIIINSSGDKVFLAQRSKNKDFSPGKWETIGGRMEINETPDQSLIREVKEEINSEIKSFNFFKDYFFNGRAFKTYIVELKSDPQPNSEDFMDYAWFKQDEIKKLDFAINCKERIIDYFINNK